MQDDSPHLATFLIYEYYMASAMGTFISMKYRAVPAATMVVAVARVLSLPLAFLYAYGFFGVRSGRQGHGSIVSGSLCPLSMFICASHIAHLFSQQGLVFLYGNICYTVLRVL